MLRVLFVMPHSMRLLLHTPSYTVSKQTWTSWHVSSIYIINNEIRDEIFCVNWSRDGQLFVFYFVIIHSIFVAWILHASFSPSLSLSFLRCAVSVVCRLEIYLTSYLKLNKVRNQTSFDFNNKNKKTTANNNIELNNNINLNNKNDCDYCNAKSKHIIILFLKRIFVIIARENRFDLIISWVNERLED